MSDRTNLMSVDPRPGEWITLALILACSAGIVTVTFLASATSWWWFVPLLSLLLVLHSSLQHEVLHGHPFQRRWLNEMLVIVPFGLLVPFRRFRDSHLKHHVNERLTDPYDDPETNYLDPAVWTSLSPFCKMWLNINNTLAGRMLIGPAKNLLLFYWQDSKAIARRDGDVLGAYLIHVAGLVAWLWWIVAYGSVPFWHYAIAAYLAVSILNVRTFLEHRAHEEIAGRVVVIEDRGIFAFLFLNNNFHLVHHCHPMTPWYRLPSLYQAKREAYLQQNSHYLYPNYRTVFAQYFFKRKDPVAHPLRNLDTAGCDVDVAIAVDPIHAHEPV